MAMQFTVKNFEQLTKAELYEILRVRSQIFIVEQKMNCQDMDAVDFDAWHFYLEQDGCIAAYARAYYTDADTVRIGRVLSVTHGIGLGAAIMQQTVAYIKEHTSCKTICLDAQTHAIGFYEKAGFKVVSDTFLEEGVLHVKMEWTGV